MMMDVDPMLADTGERMIPPRPGEISFVWERHRFAYQYATSFVRRKRVVDVGCGTGYGSYLLAQKAEHVVAVDDDRDAIAYCRKHFSAPNISYVISDADTLALTKKFDCVISFQVIEHLRDPRAFLTRLHDHVVPGGLVLITTPNVRNPGEKSDNPFHISEMNAATLAQVAAAVFSRYELLGIGYARPNRLRRLVQRLPVYRLGRYLRRSSKVKQAAERALDLKSFAILNERVSDDALDLLLVGYRASSPEE